MDMFETKWYFVFSLLGLKVSHPEVPHFPVHLQCLPPSSIPHAKLEPHLQVPSKSCPPPPPPPPPTLPEILLRL